MRIKRKAADKLLPPHTLSPFFELPKKLNLPHLHSPHGLMNYTEAGWQAEFVGMARVMQQNVDWDISANDPKTQLWRMNLHYFEYLPEMTPETAKGLISDWIQQSRPRNKTSSSAGWTPYALSLRISAWLDYWSIHGPFGDDAFQALFSASLREQADYLVANLETDVKGNHLIKNIRALAEMGAAYDDRSAKRWSKIANTHLKRELKTQILSDGLHFERSASYHSQVFCDLLTIESVRPQDSLSATLSQRLEIMAAALQDLTHPDSRPVHFNDSGLTMCVAPQIALEAYNHLNGKRPLPEKNRPFALAESGFYGARTETDYCVVKMGPLGPDTLMAHAHGDWGSLEYSMDGHRVFVDQGVYEYVDGPDRRLCRSTRAHNTATLDNAEQAHFFGSFRCGSRPSPQPAVFTPKNEGFNISGNLAIKGPTGKIEHTRAIDFSHEGLVIHDKANDTNIKVESRLLLHPDVKASLENNTITVTTQINGTLTVNCTKAQNLRLEAAEWFPDMGKRVPTQRILLSGTGETCFLISRHAI